MKNHGLWQQGNKVAGQITRHLGENITEGSVYQFIVFLMCSHCMASFLSFSDWSQPMVELSHARWSYRRRLDRVSVNCCGPAFNMCDVNCSSSMTSRHYHSPFRLVNEITTHFQSSKAYFHSSSVNPSSSIFLSRNGHSAMAGFHMYDFSARSGT